MAEENKKENKNRFSIQSEDKISVYRNCIAHGGNLTLYYTVNLFNYNLYTRDSTSSQINVLYNLITGLEDIMQGLQFSLMRFEDIVSPEQYIDEFINTIRQWDDNFVPTDEFLNNVQYISQDYCILAISIDNKEDANYEDISIKDIAKNYKEKALNFFANFKQNDLNTERVDSFIEKISNAGQGLIRPCSEKLLLNYYMKRIYPSYNLIIPEEDFDSTKLLMGFLQQDFIPHFNYFEMDNCGVEIFGAEPQSTYGSVIDILDFPQEISCENFALDYDRIICNNYIMKKEQAKLKIKRQKADIEYEEDTSMQTGGDNMVELEEYKDLAMTALAALAAGRKMIMSDIHLLVLAQSLPELNKKRAKLISDLKNMDIIATFNPDQAKTYMNSFVKLRPTSRDFMLDLYYVLAFRLNNGSSCGDFDSKFTASILGEYAESYEATVMN